MYSASATFKFEAAHRLKSSYSEECMNNVHGHSYKAIITISSPTLNEDGMVIDFKLLKEWWNIFFDDWDHALFLHRSDPLNGIALGNVHLWDLNPTAERMASTILRKLIETPQLRPEGGLFSVTLYETEGNSVTVSEDVPGSSTKEA